MRTSGAMALLGLVLATALLTTPAAARSLGDSSGPRTPLSGNTRYWATTANLQGPANSSHLMRARLHVGYPNPEKVATLAMALSDPKSEKYGQYLTPHEFKAQHAPSKSYIDSLVEWSRKQGFHIAYVATNHKYIALEGTVAGFAKALQTTFGMYKVQGKVLRCPESNPSLPTKLFQGHQLTFLGLDQGQALRKSHRKRNFSAAAIVASSDTVAKPIGCIFEGRMIKDQDPILGCAYTPQQIRSAYGVPTDALGAGQTVAVLMGGASPTIQQDLDQFSAVMGLPSTKIEQVFPPLNYTGKEGTVPPFDAGLAGEETLDVEAVHGMAPHAKIIYVGAQSLGDLDTESALNFILEKKLANLVSNSFSQPLLGPEGIIVIPDILAVYRDLLKQAAILGIGVYYATGDHGDESHDKTFGNTLTPNYPAADPFAIAVGGTTLLINKHGQTEVEVAWGNSACQGTACGFFDGGGGGIATVFDTPAFQKGNPGVTAVLTAAGAKKGRVTPDVAAIANEFAAYFVGETQTNSDGTSSFSLSTIGGTSLATPAFVGMMAVAQEKTGRTYGFANPFFYQNAFFLFNDIISSPQFTIANFSGVYVQVPSDESLQASYGFDDATGLGVPGPLFFGIPFKSL